MRLSTLILVCLIYSISNSLIAQPEAAQTVFQSFHSEEVLNIKVKTDLRKLIKFKSEEEYQDAELSYTHNGSDENWLVEVRARGNLRQRVCYIPPLKVKFPKEEVAARGWKNYRSLKLVSFCKTQKSFQDLVAKEYHIYKIYNLLTEFSFKVQLVKIDFQDSKNKMKPLTTLGFFIEPEKEMAERLDAQIIEPRIVSPRRVVKEAYDLFCVFQFMMGNTDWSVYNLHNLKLIYKEGYKFPIPVAYDFDNSGFVNAPYAAPHELIPIENIRQRCYMGLCREEGTYEKTFEHFQNKKAAIFEYLDGETLLSASSKKMAIRYLNEFYDILDNPKKCRKMIVEYCDKFLLK